MRERTWTAATLVTLGRIAFLPVLWLWAFEGRVAWVGIGVMASFLADIVDGQLARRLNQVTPLGSRLDSIGDGLLEVSTAVWLAWFLPELRQQPYLAVAAFAMGSWLLAVAVGLARFGRFLNLHLYTGKASGVACALFAMDALVFGFRPPLFYVAGFVFVLGNLEALLVLVTRSQVDEHIGSILRRPRAAVALGAAR